MMEHTEYQYSVLLLSYYVDAIKVTIGGGVKSLNGVTIDLMTAPFWKKLWNQKITFKTHQINI